MSPCWTFYLEWDGGWVGKDETIGELKRNGRVPDEDLVGHVAHASSRTYTGPAGPWANVWGLGPMLGPAAVCVISRGPKLSVPYKSCLTRVNPK